MREIVIGRIKNWRDEFGLTTRPPKGMSRWSILRDQNLRVWEDEWLETASDEDIVSALQWLTASIFRGYA
jgi:hypothetical protein